MDHQNLDTIHQACANKLDDEVIQQNRSRAYKHVELLK